MTFSVRILSVLLACLIGCGDDVGMQAVPGSTVRVGEPETKENTQNVIDVLLEYKKLQVLYIDNEENVLFL